MRGASGATVPAAPEERRAAEDTRGGKRWSDLRKRIGSAIVLAPLALGCLWLGKLPWALLVALGVAGCAAEWAGMCRAEAWRWPVIILPVGVAAVPLFAMAEGGVVALVYAAILVVGAWLLLGRNRRASWLVLGILYVAPAAIAMVRLRHVPLVGRWDMLFLVLIVWASDIGAYVAGRLIGGPKLAPSISPGKTRSGAVGGLVAAAAVGIGVAAWAGGPVDRLHCAAIAMLVGVSSQVGDLLESGLKRHFGVKDSGRSIPGHGGLLDRLDGMLTAAPVAALVALVVGEGILLWQ
jgi:phosphatidate cytidylyltransferase